MRWSSLSRLERAIVITGLLVMLLSIVTSSGMLPHRSFASMTAGFVMLAASSVDLGCLCWLVARRLTNRDRGGRYFFAVLLIGIAGAAPIVVVAMRLLGESRPSL